jgi:hypothetical protein
MVIEVLLKALMKILLASGVFYDIPLMAAHNLVARAYLFSVKCVKFCLSLIRRDIWEHVRPRFWRIDVCKTTWLQV